VSDIEWLDRPYEVGIVVVIATILLLKWYTQVQDWVSNGYI